MGFAALDGGGEEFGVGEDIAREDVGVIKRVVGIRNFAEMGRNELRPYKGMERDVWRIGEQRGGWDEIV